MPDIEATVMDIIARKAGVERASLTRETELSSMKVDSVDTIEVIFEIEEAFDISLMFNANRTAMGDNIKTVGDVIDLVSLSQAGPVPGPG